VPSKLEILSQVMLSYKDDQNTAMNNINALLNKKDTKEDLIDSLKTRIDELSQIHASMQETQTFILQLTQDMIESSEDNSQEKEEK
jgi:hypothetical protein